MSNKKIEEEAEVDIENFDVNVYFGTSYDNKGNPTKGTLCIDVALFRRWTSRRLRVASTARVLPDELDAFYSAYPTKIQAIAAKIALLFSDLAGDPDIAKLTKTDRAASDDSA